MATAEKKRHHYLPEWYLAGFTPSGRKCDFLFVFDLQSKQVRAARPKTVGFETHLYSVNAQGISRDAFEDLLGDTLDSCAASALKRVCCTGSLSKTELDTLLEFMSLLTVRSSRFRSELRSWMRQQTGLDLEQAVEDSDSWLWLAELLERAQPSPEYAQLVARALADPGMGGCGNGTLSPGEIVAAMSGQLKSTADKVQFWQVAIMWALYPMRAAHLREKTWALHLADRGASFVCSDMPVGATWRDGCVAQGDLKYAEEDALVTFPLDRHAAVVGSTEGKCSVAQIAEVPVAMINRLTINRAARLVFASSLDFPFVCGHTIGRGKDVFLLPTRRRAKE